MAFESKFSIHSRVVQVTLKISSRDYANIFKNINLTDAYLAGLSSVLFAK